MALIWRQTRHYGSMGDVIFTRRRHSFMEQQSKTPHRESSRWGVLNVKAGDVVLSHPATRAVPSALRGLTTVFGMGTGVTLAL